MMLNRLRTIINVMSSYYLNTFFCGYFNESVYYIFYTPKCSQLVVFIFIIFYYFQFYVISNLNLEGILMRLF